ncbi:hypothetical protein N0O92_14300 [Alkalihalobacillus sp. MEB130]|uniref:DUF6671 family protein n=1 Tax=Alkalihalobacillus sp. MEB130 TaxID=2976704 RepID=UPI0028E01D5D|nr:DUF6671 family protein [Alkalihalobacillus sp. MEB130]MDT8861389.1 hypothetical protein [Alkalihalobacillus sp. MEB130]
METKLKQLFQNRTAVIATMHQKEKVIAPLLERELGLQTTVLKHFNTDQFGTFTNEVERAGNQLEAAKNKLKMAMKQSGLDIGVASEGSFGPHPVFTFSPFNRELILLLDKKHQLEITGYIANGKTNFSQKEVEGFEDAYKFALSVGFPEHGVIVKKSMETKEANEIRKGIQTVEELKQAVADFITPGSLKSLYLETDMRAMYNPTRMKNIQLATKDLLAKMRSFCPSCDTPGFAIKEVKRGLPCHYCGMPTDVIRSHLYQCEKCQYEKEDLFPNGMEFADPTYCNRCNP